MTARYLLDPTSEPTKTTPATTFLVTLLASLWSLLACVHSIQPGDPLSDLTAEERSLFELGRKVLEREFTPETGLGPLFNAAQCSECHEDPTVGGGGDEVEVHVASFHPDGFCDPLVERGGPVIQQDATPALRDALGIEREPLPPEATVQAGRSTPDLFGFGLLDSVPDAAILALEDPDDRNGDGISGRANRFFDGRLGRFGRKALVPTLREFNDGAFVIEQGITNPGLPTEESVGGAPIPEGVDPLPEPELSADDTAAADAFVRFLAPPAPQPLYATGRKGRELFTKIGCDACHVPTLETSEGPVKALSRRKVSAYTDLLLHDMGEELSDICLGLATPSEFRTEPLMGMRLATRFLHDGRAASLEEAILLHGGEAARSRDRFKALDEKERAALIKFLKSL